jgi:electron transport complex protein RnfC
MRERLSQIVEALRICRTLLEPSRLAFAVGESSRELAVEIEVALREAALPCEIALVPRRYPQGSEQLLLAALQGGSPPQAAGSVVLSVATLNAIYEAVVLGVPLIERIVTVTGPPVGAPRNLKARIGTPVGELLEECGGLVRDAGKLVLGGVMRGTPIDSLQEPVTKGVLGVTAFSRREARPRHALPCTRCGSCVQACPWGLAPLQLYKLLAQGRMEEARAQGLDSCTECGCCSFACPSRIPLTDALRQGRALLPRGSDG